MEEGRRELILYAVAVISFIVIGWYTKRLLTWNLAFPFFVLVIDVVPRLFDRIVRRPPDSAEGPP